MKNQKGITLIAVIITVIAMLILAGVSITMTVGENGILENSQDAAEKTENAASKDYILEAWAYVLAKCEDISLISSSSVENGFSSEENEIFENVSIIFSKYISNYGEGSLDEICNIINSGSSDSELAYKVTFKLTGSDENKIFYIVNDTKVYDEKEFNSMFKIATK